MSIIFVSDAQTAFMMLAKNCVIFVISETAETSQFICMKNAERKNKKKTVF